MEGLFSAEESSGSESDVGASETAFGTKDRSAEGDGGGRPHKEAEDFEPHVDDQIAAAQQKVEEVLQEQLATCSCARQHLSDELELAFGLWESTDQPPPDAVAIRSRIHEALSGGAPVEEMLEEAQSLGLPLSRTTVWDRLKCVRWEEELEGLWRCLASALAEADRMGVAFWLQEAQQQGLSVPGEVDTAFAALKQEEADRLARWEAEASLNARVAEARRRGDRELLREMVLEARWSGADPSAPTAALAALSSGYEGGGELGQDVEGDDIVERGSSPLYAEANDELDGQGLPSGDAPLNESETLYISSPNGQEHCFGRYQMVQGLVANGQPVWMQLGGGRWLYSDTNGRWNIGSSKVKERDFKCSAGFIYCGEHHNGKTPDKATPGSWIRWDDEAKQWCRDEAIMVSPNFEEVATLRLAGGRRKGTRTNPQASRKAGHGCARVRGRGRGFVFRKRSDGAASASSGPQQQPAGPKPQPRPSEPQPPPQRAGSGGSPRMPPPPASAISRGQLTRAKALRRLGLSDVKCPTAEDLRKAYRQAALRWHPDRRQNHGQEANAKQKFQEVRDAFELLKAALDPFKFIGGPEPGPSASSSGEGL